MVEKSRATILGENLKRIREEKGVTRKELAAATGITANMIGEYETGKKLPPLDKIFILADSLEVSIVSLTGDNNFNPVYPDIDSKVFEYRLKRAKKMLKYLDEILFDYSVEFYKNDIGNVVIIVPEFNTSPDEKFTTDTTMHHIIFKDEKAFVYSIERAEDRALDWQIPFNQALIDVTVRGKKEIIID